MRGHCELPCCTVVRWSAELLARISARHCSAGPSVRARGAATRVAESRTICGDARIRHNGTARGDRVGAGARYRERRLAEREPGENRESIPATMAHERPLGYPPRFVARSVCAFLFRRHRVCALNDTSSSVRAHNRKQVPFSRVAAKENARRVHQSARVTTAIAGRSAALLVRSCICRYRFCLKANEIPANRIAVLGVNFKTIKLMYNG